MQEEAAKKDKLYPPCNIWKLAFLLFVTLLLYSLFWSYRTARDIQRASDNNLKPFLWVLVPLVGPVFPFAYARMMRMLQEWAVSVNAEVLKPRSPTLVGVLFFISFVLISLVGSVALSPLLMLPGVLLFIVLLMTMQRQLNAIKAAISAPSTGDETIPNSVVAKIILSYAGLLLVLAAGMYFWSDDLSKSNLHREELHVGTVLKDASGRYQLRVNNKEWYKVEPGTHSEGGDYEFVSDYKDDWATIYSFEAFDMKSGVNQRVAGIRASFPDAKCKESRSLSDDGFAVVSKLDCSGKDLFYGNYHYHSRTEQNDQHGVEMFIFVASSNGDEFMRQRMSMLGFANGLKLL